MNQSSNIYLEVKNFVKEKIDPCLLRKFSTSKKSSFELREYMEATFAVVNSIIDAYTVHEYEFTLAMDFLVQMAHENIEAIFFRILKEADLHDSQYLDSYFGVYYALSILYKKKGKTEKLEKLLAKKYDAFDSYPLHYEVRSRYFKRVKNYKDALKNDQNAINSLKFIGVTNPGVLISYASTICTMLENNTLPDRDDVKDAIQYTEEAIARNPVYPKYPFVKAKLVFLEAIRYESDVAIYQEAFKEAQHRIQDAHVLLQQGFRGDNNYYKKELASFDSFSDKMNKVMDELRFTKTFEYLNTKKKAILSKSSHDECYASNLLPDNPELKPGDKFFFVCYSSKDFKSVYSDLIELYKRKVHFVYDHSLINGHSLGWDNEVKGKIESKDCVGVLFFISKNIFYGEAIHKEIKIAKESEQANMMVNLEEIAPSHILTDFIIDRYVEAESVCQDCIQKIIKEANGDPNAKCQGMLPKKFYLSDEYMKDFLDYFPDKTPYAIKQKQYNDDGTVHIDSLIENIRKAFEKDCTIIGDNLDEIIKDKN